MNNDEKQMPVGHTTGNLGDVMTEVMDKVQTTLAIVQGSVLALLSTNIGPLVDWVHPTTGSVRPSILYLLTLALSGDRKSTTDALVFDPIYEHDEAAFLEHKQAMRDFVAEDEQWSIVKSGLNSRKKKLVKDNKPTDSVDAELAKHAKLKPVEPKLVRFIRTDITPRAVVEALKGDGVAISLHTDEGKTLLDGSVLENLGALNQYWDGKRMVPYDRGHNDIITAYNPRVTMNIQVQPDIFDEYRAKRGKAAKGSGLFARFLIARSKSLAGFREQTDGNAKLVHLPTFHSRVASLIRQYVEQVKEGRVERDVLEFDDEAKTLWKEIEANVENDLKPGLYLHDIFDFAGKYMDHIGRIACLAHYYYADTAWHEGDTPESRAERIGKISSDMLLRAESTANAYLHEYKAMFAPPPLRPQELVDVDQLYDYLYRVCFMPYLSRFQMQDPTAGNSLWPTKNSIRRNCGVRGKDGSFDRALEVLIRNGAACTQFWLLGKSSKPTEMIGLNPEFFHANPLR
ncbi:MAG: YfjI family protein [Pseudoxanthomonas sp.]